MRFAGDKSVIAASFFFLISTFPRQIMATSTTLHAVAHRLNATPVKELPPVASYLASGIADSRNILSTAHSSRGSSHEAELAQLVQKLKARITSLLNDKTPEGRWTAVVIVKATVEAGQWEILRECANWIRSLISILGV